MGKHFFVNGDKGIDPSDRLWVTTSNIFHTIFDRVGKFFKQNEQACKEKCFEDTGVDGIDLDSVSKDCFNIFYIRCKDALENYPDAEILAWLDQFPNEPEKRDGYVDGISWYWANEVLRRLQLDKRYDVAWIEGYRRMESKTEK